MANVGLRKPYVAKFNRATKTYSDGFRYSRAVSMGITPNYAEASLYGDDSQVEYEKDFTYAQVTLGTTSTPIRAASTMFGHQVDFEQKKVIYKTSDEANYVGVGITGVEKVDGVTQYVALIILCAKFADSAESYNTKGDQIQFNTPSIEGAAIAADDDGNWKITKIFDTAEAADEFVREYLNIDPATTYTVTQNLTHVTSDFSDDTVTEGEELEITLTEDTGYTLSEPEIKMGGVDITSTAWDAPNNKITISSVTGNVVITAEATE